MNELIKQLEIKHNCSIFYDDGFDDCAYWIATPSNSKCMFNHAFGVTLDELQSKIENNI